jgi:hypothetical protein
MIQIPHHHLTAALLPGHIVRSWRFLRLLKLILCAKFPSYCVESPSFRLEFVPFRKLSSFVFIIQVQHHLGSGKKNGSGEKRALIAEHNKGFYICQVKRSVAISKYLQNRLTKNLGIMAVALWSVHSRMAEIDNKEATIYGLKRRTHD